MSDKKVFIQVQCDDDLREMLAEIAAFKRVSMSEQVRTWIRNSHKHVERAKGNRT